MQDGWWPSRDGADDEAGSLDEVTPEAVARAAAPVRTGRVRDLSHVLHSGTPAVPGRSVRQFPTTSAHAIDRRVEGAGPEGPRRSSVQPGGRAGRGHVAGEHPHGLTQPPPDR